MHARAVSDYPDRLKSILDELLPNLLGAPPPPADAALNDLIGAGGKRLRPLLTFLTAGAAGGDPARAWPLAAAVELLHTGTLLHDDVIDEADVRRGRATARKTFGNGVAVLSGDFALFAALDVLVEHGDLLVLKRAMAVARDLATGELAQLQRRGQFQALDPAAYFEVIGGKTASLFSFACWGGAHLGGAEATMAAALERFGNKMGLAFQITDDLLDLLGDAGSTGKNLGRDLAEGLITLPILEAIADDPELGTQMQAGQGDPASWVRRALDTAGPQRARQMARRLCGEAQQILDALEPSDHRETLRRVCNQISDRVS
jgi:octaprenyl-diphosphate synthase